MHSVAKSQGASSIRQTLLEKAQRALKLLGDWEYRDAWETTHAVITWVT